MNTSDTVNIISALGIGQLLQIVVNWLITKSQTKQALKATTEIASAQTIELKAHSDENVTKMEKTVAKVVEETGVHKIVPPDR